MTSEEKKTLVPVSSAVGLILIAVLLAAWNFKPAKKYSQTSMYFTEDAGKTFYLDNNENIPPYQHNGNAAVGAALYRTEKNSTPFCGYLFRFRPDVKAQLDTLPEGTKANGAYATPLATEMEIQSPGVGGTWYKVGTPGAAKVMDVASPDGSEVDRVLP